MRRFLFMALSTTFVFFLSGGINSACAMKFLSNKNKRDVVVLRPYIKGHLHGRTSDMILGEAILTDSKFLELSFFIQIENIRVEISRDDKPVYSETFSKVGSSFNVILPNLDNGDYFITVTGDNGVSMYGKFSIR